MTDIDIPVWAVPLLIAVIAALGGVVVALINRRPNQQSALLEAMAKNREADSKENQRLDTKVDKLYVALGLEREYSMEWEEWHRGGMQDPPGRPKRNLDPTNN